MLLTTTSTCFKIYLDECQRSHALLDPQAVKVLEKYGIDTDNSEFAVQQQLQAWYTQCKMMQVHLFNPIIYRYYYADI